MKVIQIWKIVSAGFSFLVHSWLHSLVKDSFDELNAFLQSLLLNSLILPLLEKFEPGRGGTFEGFELLQLIFVFLQFFQGRFLDIFRRYRKMVKIFDWLFHHNFFDWLIRTSNLVHFREHLEDIFLAQCLLILASKFGNEFLSLPIVEYFLLLLCISHRIQLLKLLSKTRLHLFLKAYLKLLLQCAPLAWSRDGRDYVFWFGLYWCILWIITLGLGKYALKFCVKRGFCWLIDLCFIRGLLCLFFKSGWFFKFFLHLKFSVRSRSLLTLTKVVFSPDSWSWLWLWLCCCFFGWIFFGLRASIHFLNKILNLERINRKAATKFREFLLWSRRRLKWGRRSGPAVQAARSASHRLSA